MDPPSFISNFNDILQYTLTSFHVNYRGDSGPLFSCDRVEGGVRRILVSCAPQEQTFSRLLYDLLCLMQCDMMLTNCKMQSLQESAHWLNQPTHFVYFCVTYWNISWRHQGKVNLPSDATLTLASDCEFWAPERSLLTVPVCRSHSWWGLICLLKLTTFLYNDSPIIHFKLVSTPFHIFHLILNIPQKPWFSKGFPHLWRFPKPVPPSHWSVFFLKTHGFGGIPHFKKRSFSKSCAWWGFDLLWAPQPGSQCWLEGWFWGWFIGIYSNHQFYWYYGAITIINYNIVQLFYWQMCPKGMKSGLPESSRSEAVRGDWHHNSTR